MRVLRLFPFSTLVIVLVASGLNGLKPVHIDDTAYLRFAEQIADDPAHPYAFDLFWYETPQPAMEVLAPPVYLYWLALGVRAAPDQPVVWHLMVFPWLLLLAGSLNWLSQRWRGGSSFWLVAAFVLSPVVLPGINLMLDIPALALALASLVLFTRALDASSMRGAVLAGLVLALAFETKYTAATMGPVWLGVAWLSASRNRWRCLLAAGTAAALGIVLIEGLIAWGHGQSHLLLQLATRRERFPTPLSVYLCQIMLAVPAVPLIALMQSWQHRHEGPLPRVLLASVPVIGVLLGVGVWAGSISSMHAAFLGLSWLLLFTTPWGLKERAGQPFLYWFLLCEVVYCVLVSPFPAMRRVLGPAVPLALLILGGDWPRRQHAKRWLAGASIACGLAVWSLDFQQAHLQRQAAASLADRYDDSTRSIWFAGHWGWAFYAQAAGMRPVVPDQTVVQPGDLIVVPAHVYCQPLEMPSACRHIERLQVRLSEGLPLQMNHYYGGALQLEWQPVRELSVDVFEATDRAKIAAPERNQTLGLLETTTPQT